jgi:hypothetical protein
MLPLYGSQYSHDALDRIDQVGISTIANGDPPHTAPLPDRYLRPAPSPPLAPLPKCDHRLSCLRRPHYRRHRRSSTLAHHRSSTC